MAPKWKTTLSFCLWNLLFVTELEAIYDRTKCKYGVPNENLAKKFTFVGYLKKITNVFIVPIDCQ